MVTTTFTSNSIRDHARAVVSVHDCATANLAFTAALAAGMAPFGYAGSVVPADRLAIDGTVTFDSMADLPALVA